jgi:hypothetical protein
MFVKTLTDVRKPAGIKIEILEPTDLFKGRAFGDWLGDWWNWLISDDPSRQTGPVKMLRAGLSYDEKGRPVHEDFNVCVGDNKEEVYEDQAVLFPLLNTMIDSRHIPGADSEPKMRYLARNENDSSPTLYGNQFEINKQIIFDDKNDRKISDLRAESPEFTLTVPSADYGTSLKDRLDVPLTYPGQYKAVTDGYWIFIKCLPKDGSPYRLFWHAEGLYNYITGAAYELEVVSREGGSTFKTRTSKFKKNLPQEFQ